MSIIKANDIQNASGGIPTVKSQQLIPTAWVNFNGTSTVAIRDSENVSSITDDGTGAYTVNIANALDNTNGATSGNCSASATTGSDNRLCTATIITTSTVDVQTGHAANGTPIDVPTASVIIMGGQA